ncbi:MAG: helix-turn-helix domain-containing protein [Duodenibacillus sp.]
MTSNSLVRDPEQLLLFETQELEGAQTAAAEHRAAIEEDFTLDPAPAPLRRARTHAPEIYARAMEMYARGSSYKTVAYVLNISVYTARDWMHRYHAAGPEHARESGKGRGFSETVRQDVRRMRYELGYSYNRIEKETGLRRTTIRSWLASPERGDELC